MDHIVIFQLIIGSNQCAWIKSGILKYNRPNDWAYYLPNPILNFLRKFRGRIQHFLWLWRGQPIPPSHVFKQRTLTFFKEKYQYDVLIETGTFQGAMVDAQKKHFNKIYSIELSEELYRKARNRFKDDKHVSIIRGDSSNVLGKLLERIDEPAIFWLDGHYSGGQTSKGKKETPIAEEVQAIFDSGSFNHVVLIDDARLFNGTKDYPTIEELMRYIKGKNQSYKVEIKQDIIRCFHEQ